MINQSILSISTRGRGTYDITSQVAEVVSGAETEAGLCHVFVQHTSASLVISESYDPSARIDLEVFMDRLAPERQAWYRHTLEGDDDSPSHMRAMLTDTDLAIPIDNGSLSLGTWQGVYLFEHRMRGHKRRVLLRCWNAT